MATTDWPNLQLSLKLWLINFVGSLACLSGEAYSED